MHVQTFTTYTLIPLGRPEYMRMAIKLIPQAIMDQYNLMPKVLNGFVYMEIIRGMYGLPQAGILANKLLKNMLTPHGYYKVNTHQDCLSTNAYCIHTYCRRLCNKMCRKGARSSLNRRIE